MTHLVIWVTSDCNLNCRLCNQKYTMYKSAGYQMSIREVDRIVVSCLKRGLHFEEIELTGGEPSLWRNIKYGVRLFSKICDTVTLVTNGNDPELIISLNLKKWIVSAGQITDEQLQIYESVKDKITFNGIHKKTPNKAISDSLPADCSIRFSRPEEMPQNNLLYFCGYICYCCNAFALSEKTGLSDSIACRFEEDFMAKFKDKDYTEEICSYCLCNGKVWNQLA
jgi:organic radical activating enzyme